MDVEHGKSYTIIDRGEGAMDKIEKLRIELYCYIDKYGSTNIKTVTKSQELDLELNKVGGIK